MTSFTAICCRRRASSRRAGIIAQRTPTRPTSTSAVQPTISRVRLSIKSIMGFTPTSVSAPPATACEKLNPSFMVPPPRGVSAEQAVYSTLRRLCASLFWNAAELPASLQVQVR